MVARSDPQGVVLLGYFFGPRLASADAAVLDDLDPANAILRVRFGALGLRNGEWPILGMAPKWDRSENAKGDTPSYPKNAKGDTPVYPNGAAQ